METFKSQILMTSLPSGGIINPGIDNYNPDNYYIQLEGLSYYKVIEYEQEKVKAKTQIEKLGVMIDYLIPHDCLNLPVTDMFAIMLDVVALTGLDIVGDAKASKEAQDKGETYVPKPYYFSNVTCPNCGKKHDKVPFNLHQIVCLKIDNLLIEGKMKWKDYVEFNNVEENIIFKFEVPRIRELRQAIKEFIALDESSNIEYFMAIKMLLLSLSLTKVEENSTKTFEKSFADLRDLFRVATGGDAMKLERIYNELLVPPVLLSKFCDCEGASSVLDITFLIADVLRLQYVNSQRVASNLYEFSQELETGHTEPPIQIHHDGPSSLFSRIREIFGGKKKQRTKSIRREILERETETNSGSEESAP